MNVRLAAMDDTAFQALYTRYLAQCERMGVTPTDVRRARGLVADVGQLRPDTKVRWALPSGRAGGGRRARLSPTKRG